MDRMRSAPGKQERQPASAPLERGQSDDRLAGDLIEAAPASSRLHASPRARAQASLIQALFGDRGDVANCGDRDTRPPMPARRLGGAVGSPPGTQRAADRPRYGSIKGGAVAQLGRVIRTNRKGAASKGKAYRRTKNNDGDSAKLGRARWQEKAARLGLKNTRGLRLPYTYAAWKKGREAQHLIPGAVGKKYKMPEWAVNSSWNGMMIPSGRTSGKNATHGLRDATLDKGKIFHIRGGGAHPAYNKAIDDYLDRKTKALGRDLTVPEFQALASNLRALHKTLKPKAAKYVDDLAVVINGW